MNETDFCGIIWENRFLVKQIADNNEINAIYTSLIVCLILVIALLVFQYLIIKELKRK